jgi:hypothetical protein
MRPGFDSQPDSAIVHTEHFNLTTLFSQRRSHPLHGFEHSSLKIFRMEAIKNQNAAHQTVATQTVDDGHSGLTSLGNDVERFLQSRAVQIHERLHQAFGGGPHRRIGNLLDLLDQAANTLYVVSKISAVGHSAPC